MEEELERKYTRGEYLGFFANHLVGIGKGTRTEKGNCLENYSFEINYINKITLEIEMRNLGFIHSYSYDVTLKGPESQVKEFMRAAKSHLEKAINSKIGIEKQTQVHEDREYKEYCDKKEKEAEEQIKQLNAKK